MERNDPTSLMNGDKLTAMLRERTAAGTKKADAPIKDEYDLRNAPALSSTLEELLMLENNMLELPNRTLACVNCEKAMWMASPTTLTCRCLVRQEDVWSNYNQTLIMLCDKRQLNSIVQEQ